MLISTLQAALALFAFKRTYFAWWFTGAVISGSALPTPDNNLDPHEWIGGTSVPTSSISAPHRSTADPQQVEDDEPNGVGRGIRAHDVITGKYHSLTRSVTVNS